MSRPRRAEAAFNQNPFKNMSGWNPVKIRPKSLSVSPSRACEAEVRYTPTKGVSQRYLRDTLWKQGKTRAIPPSAILSRKGIVRFGGYLALGAKFELSGLSQMLLLESSPPVFMGNEDHFSNPNPKSADFTFWTWVRKKSPYQGNLIPLVREWKAWILQWEQFLPRRQVLLSKDFRSRPGCRRKVLRKEFWGWGWGSKSDPQENSGTKKQPKE